MKRKSLLIVSAFMVLVAATPVFAGPGIHLGASIDPDDFLIGLRFRSKPIQENFVIVPNAEVGFGDVTMIAGNLDAHFNIKTNSEYAPYVGAGFTVNWFDWEGDSDTEIGGNGRRNAVRRDEVDATVEAAGDVKPAARVDGHRRRIGKPDNERLS